MERGAPANTPPRRDPLYVLFNLQTSGEYWYY